MEELEYQIRHCQSESCGMRYPLMTGHEFGQQCPRCGGETRLVHEWVLYPEGSNARVSGSSRRFSVILDSIRSAWNVGSIFRTAEGMGLDHLYLCGITPTPDNTGVAKTALGAEVVVPWSYHANSLELVRGFKATGEQIWALETHAEAQPLTEAGNSQVTNNIVLVVGNEVVGVDPEVLALCDRIWRIPMSGRKRSLNTAVAFGIAAYNLTRFRLG